MYKVIDPLEFADLEKLGLLNIPRTERKRLLRQIRAVKTGEFRAPQAGDWFLSGAIPEAYRASNPLDVPHYIVRLTFLENALLESAREVVRLFNRNIGFSPEQNRALASLAAAVDVDLYVSAAVSGRKS